MFYWLCGEGIGSSIPLSVVSADSNNDNNLEIVSLEDFGINKDDFPFVSLRNYNITFISLNIGNLSKIIVNDAAEHEISNNVYLPNKEVKMGLEEVYPYSTLIDEENKTIVIADDGKILLLKYNDKNEIFESKYIYDEGFEAYYANFIFLHEGKLLYQTTDSLKIINLNTWNLGKVIPNKSDEVITLISF
jgi:hypothetical protein